MRIANNFNALGLTPPNGYQWEQVSANVPAVAKAVGVGFTCLIGLDTSVYDEYYVAHIRYVEVSSGDLTALLLSAGMSRNEVNSYFDELNAAFDQARNEATAFVPTPKPFSIKFYRLAASADKSALDGVKPMDHEKFRKFINITVVPHPAQEGHFAVQRLDDNSYWSGENWTTGVVPAPWAKAFHTEQDAAREARKICEA